jgi:predicted nucleic acid-binding protein
MVSDPGYLIDTNILLRLSRLEDPQHGVVKIALDELNGRGIALYFSLQNITEFWNVSTRPAGRNGYGLSCAETNTLLEFIERTMRFLPDNDQVYSMWRQLVISHDVHGVQVHDARLVAVMLAHGVSHILTLNKPDFARYVNLQAVHPNQLQPAAS